MITLLLFEIIGSRREQIKDKETNREQKSDK